MIILFLLLFTCRSTATAAAIPTTPPPRGMFNVSSKVYDVPALDKTNQQLHVFWPSEEVEVQKKIVKFPLVSYMHGMSGGGPVDIVAYRQLLEDMASFGLVVVAPGSCGPLSGKPCDDKINAPYTDCAGLPNVRPYGWSSYYGEGLKAIEWARNHSSTEPGPRLVDWEVGVGIAGHSMGGQAAAIAAGARCAKQWNIRAVAIHHAASGVVEGAGNLGSNVSVPLAAFTTSGDGIWRETLDIYTNASSSSPLPRVYRDQRGFSHMEPLKLPVVGSILKWYNPWLAPMTAAWFRTLLGHDSTGEFHQMIFNTTDPGSLCNYAGAEGMVRCETSDAYYSSSPSPPPPSPSPPQPQHKLIPVCDVTSKLFGAVGDNQTEDTLAVQKAVNTCSTIILPTNHTFLLRPIQLLSNRQLQIRGNIAAWRKIQSWPNSTNKKCSLTGYTANVTILVPQKESLLFGIAPLKDVVISGEGIVDGGGWRWWPLRNDTTHGEYWHNCRPKLLFLGQNNLTKYGSVSNIRVSGVTFQDSPFWTIAGRGLRNVTFQNVTVNTTGCGYSQAPNTDGFNLQGENILVHDSSVKNGDDCVPIFPPSRNILVQNVSCTCGNPPVAVVWPASNHPNPSGGGGRNLYAGNIVNVTFVRENFTNL